MNVSGPTDPLSAVPPPASTGGVLGTDSLDSWINNLSNNPGSVYFDILQTGQIPPSLKGHIASFLAGAIDFANAHTPVEQAVAASLMAETLTNIKTKLSQSDVTNLVTLANNMITQPPFNAPALDISSASSQVFTDYQNLIGA